MTQKEIEQLSREELISLLLMQGKQIVALQKEVEALRMKLEKRRKPPTNSGNSSQPPSQDKKAGKLYNRPKRKHGPKAGHEKHERQFVADPEHVVELRAQRCSSCQTDLSEPEARLVDVNQITEIPPAKAEVIEVRQYAVPCEQCGGSEIIGAQPVEVWGSACLSSQLKAPALRWQLCLAHQLRNLQAVVDKDPTAFWPRAMQSLFRFAIHLHHQRQELTLNQYQAQLLRIEWLCNRLLDRPLTQPEARRLQKRFRKHRKHLFVFLYRRDVPPTNNVSERALRPSVVHRKVTGGCRSQWGADAYAALASVIDTAALQGKDAFQAIQDLLGKPALPLPAIP